MTTNTSAINKVNKGVNVTALLGARKALEEAPEAAQFKWRLDELKKLHSELSAAMKAEANHLAGLSRLPPLAA